MIVLALPVSQKGNILLFSLLLQPLTQTNNVTQLKAVLHEVIFPATCNAVLTIRKNCKLLVRCQT